MLPPDSLRTILIKIPLLLLIIIIMLLPLLLLLLLLLILTIIVIIIIILDSGRAAVQIPRGGAAVVRLPLAAMMTDG